ncbi:cupin domain-containing protein [Roseisalinus antarcticus]|uniref:Cupin domain protein n=1 Tax=Roseisalinus antarcticus TaxID=254357 RepID=A0A1Y5TRY3_9RHOB|nr:cupin domain-containing protein [Roseisalinus antarcticus]SLN70721.1 Cupin domain protein [Roseisalinus antarcticus]
MSIRVFHRDKPTLTLELISKDARFVVWPGTDAWNANVNYVVLEPGESNVPHIHPISEDTIFIIEGKGTARDYTHDLAIPFEAGCIVHVPMGVKHAICADRDSRIVSVGGPAPADVPLLKKVGAIAEDAVIPEHYVGKL